MASPPSVTSIAAAAEAIRPVERLAIRRSG
jgi:hypothetical protein